MCNFYTGVGIEFKMFLRELIKKFDYNEMIVILDCGKEIINMWRIRNVLPETKRALKEEAREAGLSVGHYLNFICSGAEPRSRKGWRTIYIDQRVMPRLKKRARACGLPLSDYLRYISELEEQQTWRKQKLDKIKEIIG